MESLKKKKESREANIRRRKNKQKKLKKNQRTMRKNKKRQNLRKLTSTKKNLRIKRWAILIQRRLRHNSGLLSYA